MGSSRKMSCSGSVGRVYVCCPEHGLEELCWNTELKESPELSQHEELQDLELHDGKMV